MSRSRKKHIYRGSRRFDQTCRCNGGCPYCLSNRMHATVQRLVSSTVQMREINAREDGRSTDQMIAR